MWRRTLPSRADEWQHQERTTTDPAFPTVAQEFAGEMPSVADRPSAVAPRPRTRSNESPDPAFPSSRIYWFANILREQFPHSGEVILNDVVKAVRMQLVGDEAKDIPDDGVPLLDEAVSLLLVFSQN